jgi:hypothetical protein
MPRFLLTGSELALQHKENAVAQFWSGGQDSILSLDLKKVGNALQIPFGMTLLMMGTTDELAARLSHVKSRRIEAITAKVPSGGEAFIMTKAARKRTAESLGIHAQRKLSVIALHGGNAGFDKSWTSILANAFFTPPITSTRSSPSCPRSRSCNRGGAW